MEKQKNKKSSGTCVKEHNRFIQNGWYCLIQSLGPANQSVYQVNMITTNDITVTEIFKTELKRKYPEVFFAKVFGSVQKQRQNLKVKKM